MQPSTLHDMYELLRALDRDHAGPQEALARLTRSRGAAELAELDLVWERSAYDCSLHFDALLPGAVHRPRQPRLRLARVRRARRSVAGRVRDLGPPQQQPAEGGAFGGIDQQSPRPRQ